MEENGMWVKIKEYCITWHWYEKEINGKSIFDNPPKEESLKFLCE